MFRSVDWTHDIIIVKWREVTWSDVKWRLFNFFESRICPNMPEYLPNVPKCRLNTRDDKSWSDTYSFDTCANFALWHMLHHFNPRKRFHDYQRYFMLTSILTVLPLRSMSCTLGNSFSLQPAEDYRFCRYYTPLSAQNDILKNFLCIW